MILPPRQTKKRMVPSTKLSSLTTIALAVSSLTNDNYGDVVMATSSSSTPQDKSKADTFEGEYTTRSIVNDDSSSQRRRVSSLRRKTTSLNELVTTYDGSLASAGFMFDIKATTDPIIIRSMNINTIKNTNDARIEIWTKEGSFSGYEKNPNAWKLWLNDTVVAKGAGNPTLIPSDIFPPKTVSEGEIHAFYVSFPDGAYLRYSTNEDILSYGVSNGDLILYGNGAAKRKGFNGAVISPRTFNGALHYEVVAPSDVPTTAADNGGGFNWVEAGSPTPPPTSYPTNPPTTLRPTPHPIAQTQTTPTQQSSSAPFGLKLYWHPGSNWQNNDYEMKWCMECSYQCEEGESIMLDWCQSSSSRQQFVHYEQDDTIRPVINTSLCMTDTNPGVRSEDYPIRLRTCNGGYNQKFIGLNDDTRFEIHPKSNTNRCLSQAHHPKAYERVYPERCSTALRDKTSYWIKV